MTERPSPAPLPTPAERPAVVKPRDAASLLVVRPNLGTHAHGASVLMGMRGARHRFMPNKLVFPGGAVDPGDGRAAVARPMRPATARLMEQGARPGRARALAAAAARELEEETGLSLGTPPALDGLEYLCRAITPPTSPIRFNARFLVVSEDQVSGDLAGSGELEELRWFGVDEALALDLAWVTAWVLRHLIDFLALSPEARDARPSTLVCRSRNWVPERARA